MIWENAFAQKVGFLRNDQLEGGGEGGEYMFKFQDSQHPTIK